MARKNSRSPKGRKPKQQEEEEEETEDPLESPDESDDNSGDDDDETSESGSESDGEEDVAAALFKGPNDEESESDEDDDSNGDESTEDTNKNNNAFQSESYTFDLRNMLAINTDQLEIAALYKGPKKNKTKDRELEIPLDPVHGASLEVNEDYLLSKATDGCTKLIQCLWDLPTEASDAGPLATLPTYDEVRLPRAMVSPSRAIDCCRGCRVKHALRIR